MGDLARAYVEHLVALDRASTARSVAVVLRPFLAFLVGRGVVIERASADDLHAYRAVLASPTAGDAGCGLALSTQGTHLAVLTSFYGWLRRRGLTVADPTRHLELPRLHRRTVQKDYLDQQEAQAFLDAAAAAVDEHAVGSKPWAVALRNLAMVAVGIASGRRCAGICALRVEELDAERGELRVAREKDRVGRVLPLAPWAVSLTVAYRDRARPLLARDANPPWLFLGHGGGQLAPCIYQQLVYRLHRATCAANPDLTDLPAKRISTHSLRVSTARLLFANGCPIRSVNEILLHRDLSTTARYTPVPVEELRRVLVSVHPRA